MLGETPICMNCTHRMAVKMAVQGQAQRGNGHRIEVIGNVREEITQSICRLAPLPITNNPCVIECSEFELAVTEPKLRKPETVKV